MIELNSSEACQSSDSPVRSRWTRPWVFALFCAALFSFLAGAVGLWGLPYFNLDISVSHLVQELPGSGTVQLMHYISLAGDNVIASSFLVALAAIALLLMKARREAAVLIGAVVISQILKIGIKQLIGRPRPTTEIVKVLFSAQEIYSFPSGHTVHYTVFFGLLFFFAYTLVKPVTLRWSLCLLLGGMIAVIGLARIFLGAHWVSDVIGGYLLGGAVLTASIGAYRQWVLQHVASVE